MQKIIGLLLLVAMLSNLSHALWSKEFRHSEAITKVHAAHHHDAHTHTKACETHSLYHLPALLPSKLSIFAELSKQQRHLYDLPNPPKATIAPPSKPPKYL